jgi:UDP-glucuronate 4-epimerase
MSDRYLVTGAFGCIGAWTVRELAEAGAAVVALDLAPRSDRYELVTWPVAAGGAELVTGVDICDPEALGAVLDEHEITRVIHLAALQIPFCKADPALGARVNVVGTVNVFEAVKARRERIPGVVYASSIGALGPDGGAPATHYGVYKQTNEGSARIYWADDGIPSVGLRPYVVYGIGRDQGMTSIPTQAMLAAASGAPTHIPYGGESQLHHAQIVAQALIKAADNPVEGAHAFDLGGPRVHMREVVAAIEAVVPELRGQISFDEVDLPFPSTLDSSAYEAMLGPLPTLGLEEGVRTTIDGFRALIAAGILAEKDTPDAD